MRKVAAVLLVVVAFASYAEKQKAAKSKDKRFEAIAVQASSVTGSYRGPAESYGLVLELAPNGTLRGNYVEMGRVAVLNNIALNGSEFTARASFDDGSSRTITGSFANRVLNGATAFGIRMHEVPVEGFGQIDTFFERL
ncbi:MAG TPA: hypothetical protein VGQ36_23615 [Thermoanaerobaculia bacterium]|nr:hypothetical protein [Thermoanaerobaculia bacterium]